MAQQNTGVATPPHIIAHQHGKPHAPSTWMGISSFFNNFQNIFNNIGGGFNLPPTGGFATPPHIIVGPNNGGTNNANR
jgi:hypothetical protein